MLHRFYQTKIVPQDGMLILTDPELVRQLTAVLRLNPDDQFIIFTPHTEYTVAFVSASEGAVRARLVTTAKPDRTPKRRCILYQALLKKDNFEWILQKGTELGIHGFVPLVTERTIVRKISDHKRARYQKILTEATEQCGGSATPALSGIQSLTQLTTEMPKLPGSWLMANETETATPLHAVITDRPEPLRIIIGPEGGFTPAEIDRLISSGARSIQLGPRILRAETAAIAAASIILLSE